MLILYILVSYLVVFVLCFFCAFVLGCGSLAPNEDIVRFRCGGESYTLFEPVFVKKFQFLLYFFLVLGLFVPF